MEVLAIIILAVAYALADRFGGGGWPALDDKLPGRGVFWGAVLGAAAGAVFYGWPAIWMALGWFAYRTPGWRLFPGSSATPVGWSESLATLGRHAIILIPAFIVGVGMERVAAETLVLMMAGYACLAAALATWYGARNKAAQRAGVPIDPDDMVWVEAGRGAIFGACLALGLA